MHHLANTTRTNNDNEHKLLLHQLSAIILAGGKSSRYGSPKVLQSFREEPFLARIVNALTENELKDIYLVLGYKARKYKRMLSVPNSLEVIRNRNFKHGQFSSIQAGIRVLAKETPGVILCLIDQPHILPYTYHAVIMHACSYPGKIIIPTYQNRGGHPIYIPRDLFSDILGAASSQSLRDILTTHKDLIHRVEINDPGLTEDIDTREDLRRIEKLHSTLT